MRLLPPSQLYWPDDKKWYLIQVQSVNPKARTAKCVLMTSCCRFDIPSTLLTSVQRPLARVHAHVLRSSQVLPPVERFSCTAVLLCFRVQYTSGEVEDLSLEEIIAEGHMSILIP